MKNIFNQIGLAVGFTKSLDKQLEKELSSLSLAEKKEFIQFARKIYIEKNKYIPQGGKFSLMENLILAAIVKDGEEKKQVNMLVSLMFFDTLSLKDKMRIEGLVGDYIDTNKDTAGAYPDLAFNNNLMSIIHDDIILDLMKQHSLDDMFIFRGKILDRVKEAKKGVSAVEIERIEKEIYKTDGLKPTGISEIIIRDVLGAIGEKKL